MRYFKIIMAALLFCAGCGADTNINGALFSLDGSKESINGHFVAARAEYNAGNYVSAEALIRKVLISDPDHGDAALLLANILLGKAGVDPFDVTIKLISLQTSTSLVAENGVSNLFADLAGVLNVTDDDFAALGTINTEDFEDLPVLVPYQLDNSETNPRSTVSVLRYVNEAIAVICPFVSEPLRANSADDARHSCTASSKTSDVVAKHDLTWAMAHLAEAIIFNAVLTYSPTVDEAALALNPFKRGKTEDAAAATSSNLLLRVNKMQSSSPTTLSELATFTTQMNTVNTLFSSVFNTSETGMLNATMDDITAISDAFAGIAGIPESVTSQITSSFDQLTTAAQQANSGTTEITPNEKVEAFREELQSGMAATLSTSVDDALTTISEDVSAEELATFNENKTAVCENLDSILNYEGDEGLTALPESCD